MTGPFFTPQQEPEPEAAPESFYPDELTQPPMNEVGVVLAPALELARTADTWVGLTQLVVYSRGVVLEIVARSRPGTEVAAHSDRSWQRHPDLDDFRLGVQLADGTRYEVAEWFGGPGPAGEGSGLVAIGSQNGGLVRQHTLWLYPLPKVGPVHLVCQWQSRDIPEARGDLDVDALQAAATRAEVLWPMPPRPTGGWFSYAPPHGGSMPPGP